MTSSILYADSFDDYAFINDRWLVGGGSFNITNTISRTGAQCLEDNGSTLGNSVRLNFPPRSTYIWGFAFLITGVIGAEQGWYLFASGGISQVEITVNASGSLKAYRGTIGGALLGTATAVIPFGSWHYIETKIVVSPTVGVVQVWLDGVLILNLTGQNTSQDGSSVAASVLLITTGTVTYYDDTYVMDPTNGGAYTAPLGDVKMLLSMPSGNGTLNNYTTVFSSWAPSTSFSKGFQIQDSNGNVQRVTIGGTSGSGTHPTWATTGGVATTDNTVHWVVVGSGANPGVANWMAVSEVPQDSDHSYITDATVSDQDRYTFPAIAGSSVKAVAVNVWADKDDAGTRTIRTVTKSGGTTADNGSDFSLGLGTYAITQGVFETDPNTGVAWTVSGVNAAEFGVKTTA